MKRVQAITGFKSKASGEAYLAALIRTGEFVGVDVEDAETTHTALAAQYVRAAAPLVEPYQARRGQRWAITVQEGYA